MSRASTRISLRMGYPADISHEDSPVRFGEPFSKTHRTRDMPYANSIEIATATNGPGYLILLEKKRVTRLSGRAILTHGHSFALLCRNYWETGSTTGGVKPERYGFGYRYNDSARYYLYVSHLSTIVFPFRTSRLHLRHFAIIFFFHFHASFDYARRLAIRSLPPVRSSRYSLESETIVVLSFSRFFFLRKYYA